jgi:hypothetical protein
MRDPNDPKEVPDPEVLPAGAAAPPTGSPLCPRPRRTASRADRPLRRAQASKPEDWSDEDDGEWEPTMVENPSPKMIANPDYGGDVYAYDFEAVGFELWTVNPIPSPCPVSHRTAPHRMRVAVAGGGRRRGAWRRRPRQPPGGPICAEGPARDRVSSARR